MSIKALLALTCDKIVRTVLNGSLGLKDVDSLDYSTRKMVHEKLQSFDLYIWKSKIMDSLATIEISKSKNCHVEWEKFYMDGMRDFREVVYIQHDGDEIITNELTDEEFSDDEDWEDDFTPIIKAKVVDCNYRYYHNYMDAIYRLNSDCLDTEDDLAYDY